MNEDLCFKYIFFITCTTCFSCLLFVVFSDTLKNGMLRISVFVNLGRSNDLKMQWLVGSNIPVDLFWACTFLGGDMWINCQEFWFLRFYSFWLALFMVALIFLYNFIGKKNTLNPKAKKYLTQDINSHIPERIILRVLCSCL